MKVAFVLSTCDKYIDTRVKYQKKHNLYCVPENDIYYLSSTGALPNIYGYNISDNPLEIMKKYLAFFDNYSKKIETLNYDWIFMGDDDTFIYVNRLTQYLKQYNCEEPIYIGHLLDHVKHSHCEYHSGGAGYVISKALWKEIFKIKRDRYEHYCDDLCIGLWINKIPNTLVVDEKQLFRIENEYNKLIITAHRLRSEEDYIKHNKIVLEESSVITFVSDNNYIDKLKRTIYELRTTGQWYGNIIVFYIGNENLQFDFDNIVVIKSDTIDTTYIQSYLNEIGGFKNSDKRELNKLIQWSKLLVFKHSYSYKRVLYIDAGSYINESIYPLLLDMNHITYDKKIIAPLDTGKYNESLYFINQLDINQYTNDCINTYQISIDSTNYFINCIWAFDPKMDFDFNEMIDLMNKYPIFRTNEMGLMNIYFNYYKHIWVQMDETFFNFHPENWDYKKNHTINKYK
jgi:hypothetical protein